MKNEDDLKGDFLYNICTFLYAKIRIGIVSIAE